MTDRAEIVESIRQGAAQVRRTFGSLSDEQLRTPVHRGEGGWTAKEVLAHLAARQPVNDRLLLMASGDRTALATASTIDDWNHSLVEERVSVSRDALLDEFQAVQDALAAQVMTLPDELLARPIPLPQGEVPLGDLMGMAGGAHATHHAQEVELAIAHGEAM